MTKAVHHHKFFTKRVQLFAISGVLLLFTFGCGTTTEKSPTVEQSIAEINKSKDAEYRQALKSVLDQDAQTGENTKNNASIEDLMNANMRRTNKMRAIDLSQCPADFQAAYIEHIGAWTSVNDLLSDMKRFQNKYDSFGACVEAFLRGMFFDFGMIGEMEAEKQRINQRASQVSDAIKSTFYKTLHIAAKYGVDVSKYK